IGDNLARRARGRKGGAHNALYSRSAGRVEVRGAGHATSREQVIGALQGKTAEASRVASALQDNTIGLFVLEDSLFERSLRGLGDSPDDIARTMGYSIENRMYVRASDADGVATALHEGVHALDWLDGMDLTNRSRRFLESRAHVAEEEFFGAIGLRRKSNVEIQLDLDALGYR
ncbi:MAG: hypothetical protein KDB07_12175, partial [Planctomycetes bacterium]|nr:hypothetical protein [Planctomycetota bacterium]